MKSASGASGPAEPEPPIKASGRLGPFEVSLLLVSAPGARIFEGRSDDDRPVLIQVAYLRPANTPDEVAERDDYVQMIGVATDHLSADPDSQVLWHGVADQHDGTRLLIWALSWPEDALRIGRAADYVQTPQQLLAVAVALLDRIASRHDRGRLDPLLSEQLLLMPAHGAPQVVGIPIHLPVSWLSPELSPARFAPEEVEAHEPSRAGDMWRLGQTLKELSRGLRKVPAPLLGFFDALCHPNPALRLTQPATASLDLTSLAASMRANDLLHGDADTDPPRGPPASFDEKPVRMVVPAKPIGEMALTKMRTPKAIADAPTLLDARPVMMHGKAGREEQGASILERDTIVDVPRPRELDSSEEETLDQGRITVQDVQRAQADGSGMPTERLTAWDRARKPPSTAKGPGGTLVGVRKMGQQTPRGVPAPPTGPGGTVVGVRPVQLPPGSGGAQIPLLDPVTYHGPMPAGVRPQLPAALEPALPGPPLVDPATAAPPAYERPQPVEQRPPPERQATRRKRYVVEALAVIALSLGGAYLMRTMGKDDDADSKVQGRGINEHAELVLRSSPADALVVGEEDGRILGKTPLAFLVAASMPAAVLVTAKDHEPQRVLLADRGSVTVNLTPLEPRDPCDLDVRVIGGARLEGVAADVDAGLKYRIPGAAVLRNPKGRGAWIVRCPWLGGQEKQLLPSRTAVQRVELNITEPRDASLFLEGNGVGRTPARRTVPSGFVLVRAETVDGTIERWVPAFATTELHLPHPSR